jgi:hypothetical protein
LVHADYIRHAASRRASNHRVGERIASISATMAEMISEFAVVLVGENGTRYQAHACGAEMADRTWQGWLEFVPLDNSGPTIRSGRETTQPNWKTLQYWATGLTPVFLEGALQRALKPAVIRPAAPHAAPRFDGPRSNGRRDEHAIPDADAVLDPFSVYDKGEALLRNELTALAPWHLVNIIEAYELSDETPAALNRLPAASLIETIVSAVAAERG